MHCNQFKPGREGGGGAGVGVGAVQCGAREEDQERIKAGSWMRDHTHRYLCMKTYPLVGLFVDISYLFNLLLEVSA